MCRPVQSHVHKPQHHCQRFILRLEEPPEIENENQLKLFHSNRAFVLVSSNLLQKRKIYPCQNYFWNEYSKPERINGAEKDKRDILIL